ncbi:MAG TPA: tRNA pseudouridine(55) synthase TruB [Xanthobacteraceae bacterium]|nr:tRNA pseudouridine(55) synthase TruB [Xanthobacteraceae bacterium]
MKAEKRDLHGWLVLDKPVGQTSTDAVAAVKRITRAKKVGHAGTLDPLASGILPIALGEATKTVSFVMDGRKIYRFSVRWGAETDTDDADGTVQRTSDTRPSAEEIKAALPAFTGLIEQVPPRYSALKIEGERAYDLAREGAVVDLAARPVEVHRLTLMEVPDADHSVLEAECGKGTYVRALARDLGRTLGCFGHVAALRRTRVGPFDETQVTSLQRLAESAEAGTLEAAFMPVATALAGLPALKVSRAEADRLALGQSVLVRGRDAPLLAGIVSVSTGEGLVALAEMHEGALKPKRIFNLPR